MIANADIDLWVQAAGANYSYARACGPLQSDGLGLFEAAVPESEISVLVESDDFVQPCAVRSKVSQDVEVRIEMLPVSALICGPKTPGQTALQRREVTWTAASTV